MKDILGPNETVEIYFKQKIYHPKLDIDSVAITSERIILRHPHALGLKKAYTDFNYGEVANVTIARSILRSTIKCTLRSGGEPLLLIDLPNDDAEKAYGIIRENISRVQTPALPKGTMPETIICKFCGAKNKPGDIKCVNCGALLT